MGAEMKRQIFASCESNHGSWNILQVLVHTLSKTHTLLLLHFYWKWYAVFMKLHWKRSPSPSPSLHFQNGLHLPFLIKLSW